MNSDTKPAALTLTNGDEKVVIRPQYPSGGDPVICKAWDLGSPEVRYTSVSNPGADGTTYSEGFVGSRTVTLDLAILGDAGGHDAYWYASRLSRMAHPMASPILTIQRPYADAPDGTTDGTPYHMTLRGSPYTLPYTARSAALLEMQLVFTCPLGLLESELRQYAVSDIAGDEGVTEWFFPAAFPKTFGIVGAVFPQLSVTVRGDTAITPTIYIHGPVVDPQITAIDPKNPDASETFKFDGLTLTSGQLVQIDMGTGSIRLAKGSSGQILDDMTVYNTVDWTVSTFWRWLPGDHAILFHSTTGSITVEFRERRLTI